MAKTNRQAQRQERRERIAARQIRQQQTERRRSRRRFTEVGIPAGIAALLLLAVAGYFIFDATRYRPGEALPDFGRVHVQAGTELNHADYPPASGTHYFQTTGWQFYDDPVAPGLWIHNLEHGGIVLLYKCPGAGAECDALKSQLRGLRSSFPPSSQSRSVKLVIAPDSAIKTPVVALAWTRRLELPAFDERQLLAFYQAHLDRAPETAG